LKQNGKFKPAGLLNMKMEKTTAFPARNVVELCVFNEARKQDCGSILQ